MAVSPGDRIDMQRDRGPASIDDLVLSFYYRLRNDSTGLMTDLIAIQPAGPAATVFDTMIALDSSFNVGIALVPEDIGVPTRVTLTAFLQNGEQTASAISLGGTETAQKAFFPNQALALPLAGADPSVRSGSVGGQRRVGPECAATRGVLSRLRGTAWARFEPRRGTTGCCLRRTRG